MEIPHLRPAKIVEKDQGSSVNVTAPKTLPLLRPKPAVLSSSANSISMPRKLTPKPLNIELKNKNPQAIHIAKNVIKLNELTSAKSAMQSSSNNSSAPLCLPNAKSIMPLRFIKNPQKGQELFNKDPTSIGLPKSKTHHIIQSSGQFTTIKDCKNTSLFNSEPTGFSKSLIKSKVSNSLPILYRTEKLAPKPTIMKSSLGTVKNATSIIKKRAFTPATTLIHAGDRSGLAKVIKERTHITIARSISDTATVTSTSSNSLLLPKHPSLSSTGSNSPKFGDSLLQKQVIISSASNVLTNSAPANLGSFSTATPTSLILLSTVADSLMTATESTTLSSNEQSSSPTFSLEGESSFKHPTEDTPARSLPQSTQALLENQKSISLAMPPLELLAPSKYVEMPDYFAAHIHQPGCIHCGSGNCPGNHHEVVRLMLALQQKNKSKRSEVIRRLGTYFYHHHEDLKNYQTSPIPEVNKSYRLPIVHLAAAVGSLITLNLLQTYSFNMSAICEDDGTSPLHCAVTNMFSFHQSAYDFDQCLPFFTDNLVIQDSEGNTPLHSAAINIGQNEIFYSTVLHFMLTNLAKGGSISMKQLNLTNNKGQTVLHLLAPTGDKFMQLISLLTSQGVRPSKPDLFGKTPVVLAMEKEQWRVLTMLNFLTTTSMYPPPSNSTSYNDNEQFPIEVPEILRMNDWQSKTLSMDSDEIRKALAGLEEFEEKCETEMTELSVQTKELQKQHYNLSLALEKLTSKLIFLENQEHDKFKISEKVNLDIKTKQLELDQINQYHEMITRRKANCFITLRLMKDYLDEHGCGPNPVKRATLKSCSNLSKATKKNSSEVIYPSNTKILMPLNSIEPSMLSDKLLKDNLVVVKSMHDNYVVVQSVDDDISKASSNKQSSNSFLSHEDESENRSFGKDDIKKEVNNAMDEINSQLKLLESAEAFLETTSIKEEEKVLMNVSDDYYLESTGLSNIKEEFDAKVAVDSRDVIMEDLDDKLVIDDSAIAYDERVEEELDGKPNDLNMESDESIGEKGNELSDNEEFHWNDVEREEVCGDSDDNDNFLIPEEDVDFNSDLSFG